MALSYIEHVAPGGVDTFAIPFGFLAESHIDVTIDGVPATGWTITGSDVTHLLPVPSAAQVVKVDRNTPLSGLVDFAGTGQIHKTDVNIFEKQRRYIDEELQDAFDAAIVSVIGEANTLSSVGAGASIVKGKVASDLRVKSLVAGASIAIIEGSDTLEIGFAGGAIPGEANTATNLGGGGAAVFKQKTGIDLEFRSLLALPGITLNETASYIEVGLSSGLDQTLTPSVFDDFIYSFDSGLGDGDTMGPWKIDTSPALAASPTRVFEHNVSVFAEPNLGTVQLEADNSGEKLIITAARHRPVHGDMSAAWRVGRGLVPTGGAVEFGTGFNPTAVTVDYAISAVGFRYDPALDTNIVAYCRNLGTESTLDLGFVPVSGVLNTYKYEWDISAGSVEFFVDGVSIGTIATNVPPTTNSMLALAAVRGGSSNSTELNVDYFKLDQTLLLPR